MNNKFGRISLVFSIITLIPLVVFFFRGNSNGNRIAYVNSGVILDKYEGMIAAREKLEAEKKSWQNNVDTLTNELRLLLTSFEKTQAVMNASEKNKMESNLREKQQALTQYQKVVQQKVQNEQSALAEKELKKINAFIENYGRDHGYLMIFGTTSGNILYANSKVDITEDVLIGLNKAYNAH